MEKIFTIRQDYMGDFTGYFGQFSTIADAVKTLKDLGWSGPDQLYESNYELYPFTLEEAKWTARITLFATKDASKLHKLMPKEDRGAGVGQYPFWELELT